MIGHILRTSHLLIMMVCSITVSARFVHPGMLHSKADLECLKSKVQSGKEPWKSAWQQLQNSDLASLDIKPKPISNVSCGPYNIPNNGGIEFYTDGNFAYTMALLWYVTGKEKYAKKCVEILNAWSCTLDSVSNDSKELKIGVAGIKYLNAAEILRYTYNGWKKKDQDAFEKMVLEVWYPVIKDFKPRINGNWDAAIGQTIMCIGIFLDRQDIFDRAYNHLLKGETNAAINNYFNETGQCQESGRDQGHTQMGLSYLCNACEIAWKQGRDLYSAYDNRLAKGYEYTAKFMLGEDVPYVKYKTFFGKLVFEDTISIKGRGTYYPIYERAYHHYYERKGMEMPYTGRVIEKTRNETVSIGYIPWSTLMCVGFP
jgi:hypothetical protein